MIARVTVDEYQYEINQDSSRVVLYRLTPTLSGTVNIGPNKLYNLSSGTWNAAEIVRIIRDCEHNGMFDKVPPMARKQVSEA